MRSAVWVVSVPLQTSSLSVVGSELAGVVGGGNHLLSVNANALWQRGKGEVRSEPTWQMITSNNALYCRLVAEAWQGKAITGVSKCTA